MCLLLAFACGGDKDDKPGESASGGKTAAAKAPGKAKSNKKPMDAKVVSAHPTDHDANTLQTMFEAERGARLLPLPGAPPTDPAGVDKEDDGSYAIFAQGRTQSVFWDITKLKDGHHSFKVQIFTHNKEATLEVKFQKGDAIVVSEGRYGTVIECRGSHKCKGQIRGKKLELSAAAGSKVTFAGQTAEVGSGGSVNIEVNAPALFVGKTVKQVRELAVGLAIEFPKGKKLSTEIKGSGLRPWEWAMEWLYQSTSKGKMLPGEAPYTGKPRGLYAGNGPSKSLGITGNPKTFAEIDLVAVVDIKYAKRKCGKYRGSDGRTVRYKVERQTEKWSVHDRRTGKRLHKKSLEGKWPKCPETIKERDPSDVGGVTRKVRDAWFESLLNG